MNKVTAIPQSEIALKRKPFANSGQTEIVFRHLAQNSNGRFKATRHSNEYLRDFKFEKQREASKFLFKWLPPPK